MSTSSKAGNNAGGRWFSKAACNSPGVLARLTTCASKDASWPASPASSRTARSSPSSGKPRSSRAAAQHWPRTMMSTSSWEGGQHRRRTSDARASSVVLRRLPLSISSTAGSSPGRLPAAISRSAESCAGPCARASFAPAPMSNCSENRGNRHLSAAASEPLPPTISAVPLDAVKSNPPAAFLPRAKGTSAEATCIPNLASRRATVRSLWPSTGTHSARYPETHSHAADGAAVLGSGEAEAVTPSRRTVANVRAEASLAPPQQSNTRSSRAPMLDAPINDPREPKPPKPREPCDRNKTFWVSASSSRTKYSASQTTATRLGPKPAMAIEEEPLLAALPSSLGPLPTTFPVERSKKRTAPPASRRAASPSAGAARQAAATAAPKAVRSTKAAWSTLMASPTWGTRRHTQDRAGASTKDTKAAGPPPPLWWNTPNCPLMAPATPPAVDQRPPPSASRSRYRKPMPETNATKVASLPSTAAIASILPPALGGFGST
mmetsp:Transcript_2653/g.10296  ORF Transcript_2653/g.10296 Transcript_2653/m.10296 type:complete len:493 (+) Transcript_2653:447-1925(+)